MTADIGEFFQVKHDMRTEEIVDDEIRCPGSAERPARVRGQAANPIFEGFD